MKEILDRLKSISFAFIPVIILTIIMFFVGEGSTSLLVKFGVGIIMVIIGEVLFLQGVDSSIMNMGEIVGNASNKITKFFIMLIFGLIFGFFTTLAEPSVQILATQAVESGLNISKYILVFALSFGTGVCVALALFRIVARWNYKVLCLFFYSIIFIVACFVPEHFIAIAFDGGGATISDVASPFLLALASGVARNKAPNASSREANFGLIGIASMGPILAVLILGFVFGVRDASTLTETTSTTSLWIGALSDISLSLIPLLAIFFIFQAIFVKISTTEKKRILIGTAVTFVGLYLFIVGVEYGFLNMATEIGQKLRDINNLTLTILICAVLAFSLCFAEPAVHVLGSQVEELTNGNISSKLVIPAIAVAFTMSVILSVLKILFKLNVFHILIIGYAIVFILMIFCSSTFTSIAFDSGGVASGTMTSSFILPMMLGLAGAGNELAGFGIMAFVAMVPIIVIEAMGVIYQLQIKNKILSEKRRRKALSNNEDELSNIEDMENKYRLYFKDSEDE